MYPLKMNPEIKYLIWGGTKLREYYEKNCTRDDAGESWEVSTHPAGLSRIANGKLKGISLADAINKHPGEIAPEDFPFLFKIIDANGDLSVQVHPDDTYAQQYENSLRGKTEMWYIIDAKPGARIGYGWNQDMTPELVKQSAENGTLEQYINYIPVSAGQAYFIPAGRVHCIGEGLLIAEIQQNSNVTYRLYDYNRKDENGKGRQLHIDQSLAVADFSCAKEATAVTGDNVTLASCPYFTSEKITGDCYIGNTNGAFEILFFIDGQGEIITQNGAEAFQAGDTFLLPSSLGAYTVKGQCTIMRCVE
ncbi:MAG: mannose-6-phosphate isomerase [Ruminococcaceae bacterium]|nr:mannose-6-phosphate isomerase [Oscillospiraceae bacterium]